jgi:hypothetical protein
MNEMSEGIDMNDEEAATHSSASLVIVKIHECTRLCRCRLEAILLASDVLLIRIDVEDFRVENFLVDFFLFKYSIFNV